MKQIFITDLTAYNEGALIGKWIELPCADIQAEIDAILGEGSAWSVKQGYLTQAEIDSGYGHEEHFITDHEGFPAGAVSEYSSAHYLNDQAEELDSLEDYDRKKLEYMVSMGGYEFSAALDDLDSCDIYENTTLLELAERFVNEGCFGDIPGSISNYIDYAAIANDLQFNYTEHNGDLFRLV